MKHKHKWHWPQNDGRSVCRLCGARSTVRKTGPCGGMERWYRESPRHVWTRCEPRCAP